ncbi:PrsW family intramembrane metalloprotease [Candidatus Peregrinibacteria bacterium]|nr:PrsW family intramembrane metalloprotease [Candidatus Peregrinibacteria bacterium]
MFDNPFVLLGISTFFAAIPVAIWLYILFSKNNRSKKVVALVFGLGCLTAPALLGLQYVWDIFPEFNLAAFIEETIQTQSRMYIAMFVLFGAMEEIIKVYVITVVDKKTLLIKRIGDALRYSIAAALGFSFTENIYYLYEFWPVISLGELTGMYIFRSIFTTCAHMIFSGVFGYYYGIGKFSIDIRKQAKLTGKKSRVSQVISKIFNIPLSRAFQQKMVLKGLIIAVFMHATYNFLLQFNVLIPVLIFVISGFIYLKYLLSRKAGHLILATDISEKTKSTMAKKDEDVVIELLGMWFKDKRYVDVLHVCNRLLERDPDNNVVKLFKAKAEDKIDPKNPYKKVLGTVLKTEDELSEKQKNILHKHLEEKEIQKKVTKMIKEQLKKEGKKFKKPKVKKEKPSKEKTKPSKKGKSPLDQYTEGETFKIDR